MQLMERQCTRMNEEVKRLTETVQHLEQMNRHLRTELNDAVQPRPLDDSAHLMIWRRHVELLLAHNKVPFQLLMQYT